MRTNKNRSSKPEIIGYLILTKDGQLAPAAIIGGREKQRGKIRLFPSYESARRVARRGERNVNAARNAVFGDWDHLTRLAAMLPLNIQPVHGKRSACQKPGEGGGGRIVNKTPSLKSPCKGRAMTQPQCSERHDNRTASQNPAPYFQRNRKHTNDRIRTLENGN
ncbi:hypothetical protein [Geminisphaera colitermitum]|uniref:hypothetical protein n=1 Tax=Geminisphaera colitermitum TaxID=1148786 RepID=UPI000158D837|nr:hypothetical protein [Geminisphaera colitermitum]